MSKIDNLSKIKLFNGLNAEKLGEIEARCSWLVYDSNTQIIDQQSHTTNIFFVTKGSVRVVNFSLSGREIAFGEVKSGGYFGELAAIDGHPRSASVVSLSACELAVLQQEELITLIKRESSIALNLLLGLTGLVRSSTERIMELSTVAANNRVQYEILRRAREHLVSDLSANIHPIPLHSEIASRVSTTRETVSRVMNDLARRGVVERKKDSIFIRDINALNDLIYQTQDT